MKIVIADELMIANKELAFQNEEKQKRADELIIANKELAFQNEEKQKRADELMIANKELAFQNEEKQKRADELIIANKELAFQNEEKQKRADELIIANKELAFQNEEKQKRADELIIANNKELAFIDTIKKAEEKLHKLNRIYSLLSDINQAIMRTRVLNELFEKVCNISVEQGGFDMAWVGLIDESSQKLRVIAQAGRTNGFHEQVNILLKGKALSYCPIDSTLRQGKHNICKITENEEIASCQKTAYELGFRSSASFPLKVSDILKGALTFYTDEPDSFDEAEIILLDELALDISFAMEYAEKEAEGKRADKSLKESERKFRETVKNLDEGYYSCKMDGILLDHNQAFNRILGFDIDKDLKGSKLPDFWQNPDDRKVYLQELMTKGFISNYLINAKKINGEKVFVMVSSHLVKDEKGRLIRIDGTYNDFTERKLAESQREVALEALQKSDEQLLIILDATPFPIAIVDTQDNKINFWSRSALTLFGHTAPTSAEWYELAYPDPDYRREVVERWKPFLEKARSSGQAVNTGEYRVTCSDGSVLTCELYATFLTEKLIVTFNNITDRKLAEEQLHKLNRIYSLLSDINQAIVRTRVLNELFEKVCNISVEKGGFGMAWVGLIDESSQKLRVIAQAGRTNGYHEQVNISLKGKALSYCPIDSTLRQGKHNICKITENEEIAPCQKTAYELGFRSSASFPLKVSDILKGALTFYSDEPDFFDEAELKLLDELALDISFAMEYAEKEAERKRAEETLKASEKRFRITAGSLIDVVYEWDLKEKIEWFGDIDGIMGYPDNGFPRTLAGWAAKLHPEDIEKVMATIEGHLKRSEPYISEYRVMNKEGEWRWWTARGTALRDEQNIPYWWVGSITDITERKLAEEALKISKERLLFATEGANIGIWNWNIVTGELIWSDQCKALFGVLPDEAMSYQRFSDALHPDDRERTDKAVKDTLDNHKDFDIEYRSLWPDESIHWLAAKGRGFYDATGKAVRLEGIVLDIAESKRAEEEIHKLNTELEERVAKRTAQLEASNKELEAFSYSVSHDLRAPLRHVSGYVELLNKHFHSDLPEKGQHYLNSISDSVRIMGMLIDDLLQFSKTGRMEMHQSDFDMNEIVKEVIESLCKDNPDRKIDWVLGKLASVNGDEAMLRLVWTNLLSNAVKFTRTRKKARIEIGVREENKELVFFVRDNGVGFDMQYAQKLFGVFQRLHPTEEFEGTGIGLANVQRIVLRHGGRTWAEAEPDKGAAFYFSIPKNKEEI